MAYRKKTLRQMSPTARKVARLAGEAESVARRLKNLIPDLQRLDLDSKALAHAKEAEAPTCQGLNCRKKAAGLYEFEFSTPTLGTIAQQIYLCKECANSNNVPYAGRVVKRKES